jgi:selenocysteine lyase/cysteine desulfurase
MPSRVQHGRIDAWALREHYADFLDPRGAQRRILLTGHSHQAWPSVAKQGLIEAYEVAASKVDEKWDAVFAVQDELRAHLVRRLGGEPNDYAFAQNTHELVTRWLSALPWSERKKIVTTDGEFHSAFRQLRRLAELREVTVVFVASEPAQTLSERLCEAIDEDTAGVLFSCVLFANASIVAHVDAVIARAKEKGASVLVDGYHAFDVLDVRAPEGAFFVAGGYKYAQWGEGACFMRVPSGCELRPVLTGWFAGFAALADRQTEGPVAYEREGAWRFAGSTFDPASFFRARAVARFFDEHGLSVERLRAHSLAQTALIIERVSRLKGVSLATPRDRSLRAGFVSLQTPRAAELVKALRQAGVFTDSRGDMLRLGPAPYITDDEIETAIELLARALATT